MEIFPNLYEKNNFRKKYFFIFKKKSMKKKVGKKIGSLCRNKIVPGIHFSHPWSDLTTISKLPGRGHTIASIL